MTTSLFQPRRLRAISERASGFPRRLLLGAAVAVLGLSAASAAGSLNDVFSSATVLSGSTNLVVSSSVGATAEASEPAHAGNAATASVWWTWVAPDSGLVVAETAGSSFDTLLAVYMGDSVGALTLVAADDDAPGLPTSRVAFPAIRGTTYHFAVDGYAGANGDVHLGVYLPVAAAAPAITVQPTGKTVSAEAGATVAFHVEATGSFPLVYLWQKDGVPLSAGLAASHVVAGADLSDAGNYRVVITNAYGSVTSSVATLAVLATSGLDAFAGRGTLSGAQATVTAHSVGATREPGEPVHAGVASDASLWWTWTAPQAGLVALDTAGSTASAGGPLDTVLAVYTGSTLAGLTSVAANDDAVFGSAATSRVVFRAVAGTAYQIAVAGRKPGANPAAEGDIVLNLAQSANNDFFAQALEFPADAPRVQDDNRGATVEPNEPLHPANEGGQSVWWTWIAPADGTYVVDTLGSTAETVLAVYTGTALASLEVVGLDDERSDAGAALVRFNAQAGIRYHFAVDGATGSGGVSEGPIVLNLALSDILNDRFADRTTLGGQTNLVTESNAAATKEPGEPDHGGNAGGRSLWWTWTAHFSGPVVVSTRNSSFDTALAVYTGNALTELVLVAENDDGDPLRPELGSTVLFQATAGETYQIAVDGYRFADGSVATGTVVLGLFQPEVELPGGNDLFANRYALTGQTNRVAGFNTNATVEPNEPAHAGNDGGRSVWWSWIAPATAPVRFDTIGSEFDTVLAIYRGGSVESLVRVAQDRRSAGDGRSMVTFLAEEGAEYQVAVDGFNNGDGAESGRVVLGVHQFPNEPLHANDEFAQASPLAAPFLEVVGSNIGADRETGEPFHAGTTDGHSVWWTWTAPNDGSVTISTVGSQFDTVLAVYTGDTVSGLSLVDQNDDLDPGHLQSRVTFQAVAETTYRIAVDGYAGQIGFIALAVVPGSPEASAPTIHENPVGQARFAGGAGGGEVVRFKVVATGTAPLAYQWLRNGVPWPGATGAELALTNPAVGDSGEFQVVVSNALGVATSTAAELVVSAEMFNDAFAQRLTIVGASNVVRGSILGATREVGEPHHGDELGSRSVWWKWTAPANGLVEIHTHGSEFDTLLGVYTGATLTGLVPVAENDDMVRDTAYSSRVLFSAVAGQEYQIAVDGEKTNADGHVVLTVTQPPPAPVIAIQPNATNTVSIGTGGMTLRVGLAGAAPLARYQWRFNGQPVDGATNATLVLESALRVDVGLYSVAVTNDFGGVVSADAALWVQIPQRLQDLVRLPDGRMRLAFTDPDGAIASEPWRFEIQSTGEIGGSNPVWKTVSGTLAVVAGKLQFDSEAAEASGTQFYRVVER